MNNLEILDLATQGKLEHVFPHVQLLKINIKQWNDQANVALGECFVFIPKNPDVVCDPGDFYNVLNGYNHGQSYVKNCVSFFRVNQSSYTVVDSVQIFKTIDIPEFFFFNRVAINPDTARKFLSNERNDLVMDSNAIEFCIKLSEAIINNIQVEVVKTIRFGTSDKVYSKTSGKALIIEQTIPKELPDTKCF